MSLELKFTEESLRQFEQLGKSKSLAKQYKAVRNALRLLQNDPTHPGLHPHKYDSLSGPSNCDVFEAYAQNNTPGAYRIFWCYYPPKSKTQNLPCITIIAITPHP